VLCERNGRQKPRLALASGTKQKTEDFCFFCKILGFVLCGINIFKGSFLT